MAVRWTWLAMDCAVMPAWLESRVDMRLTKTNSTFRFVNSEEDLPRALTRACCMKKIP